MSNVSPLSVPCAHCGSQQEATIFTSLSADRLPVQVEQIAAGSFECVTCTDCGKAFRPEFRERVRDDLDTDGRGSLHLAPH
jgi:CpXC protein